MKTIYKMVYFALVFNTTLYAQNYGSLKIKEHYDFLNAKFITYQGPCTTAFTDDINQNATNGNGIKVNTYNNALKAFTIRNTNFINSPFTIYGDGKTQIQGGVKANKYFTVIDNSNPAAPVESFAIQASGQTTITSSDVDAF